MNVSFLSHTPKVYDIKERPLFIRIAYKYFATGHKSQGKWHRNNENNRQNLSLVMADYENKYSAIMEHWFEYK